MAISPPGKSLAIKTSITKPNVIYHWIDDTQLDRIIHAGAPKSLLVCVTSIGYLAGEFRTICDFLNKTQVSTSTNINLPLGDIIYLALIVGAAIIAIITGIYAFIGKSSVAKIIKEIRSRPSEQIKQ